VRDCELVNHSICFLGGVVTIAGYLCASVMDIYHAEIVCVWVLVDMPRLGILDGGLALVRVGAGGAVQELNDIVPPGGVRRHGLGLGQDPLVNGLSGI